MTEIKTLREFLLVVFGQTILILLFWIWIYWYYSIPDSVSERKLIDLEGKIIELERQLAKYQESSKLLKEALESKELEIANLRVTSFLK